MRASVVVGVGVIIHVAVWHSADSGIIRNIGKRGGEGADVELAGDDIGDQAGAEFLDEGDFAFNWFAYASEIFSFLINKLHNRRLLIIRR